MNLLKKMKIQIIIFLLLSFYVVIATFGNGVIAEDVGLITKVKVQSAKVEELIKEVKKLRQDLNKPYALNGVPPGTIFPFGGSYKKIPDGWLLCDGTAKSSEEYNGLWSVIGNAWGNGSEGKEKDENTDFNLPDLRGLFLRGVDDPDGEGGETPAGKDLDASLRINIKKGGNTGMTKDAVGSLQDDKFKEHKHSFTASVGRKKSDGSYDRWVGSPSSSGETGLIGGGETRPKNAYVNYIIKY